MTKKEELQIIKNHIKEVTSNKTKAKNDLIEAGILKENGELVTL